MSALDKQVGGNHYRNGTIQPVQYIEANKLQYLEAAVVKRVTRHNQKGGKGRQDIEKAIHELELLLELRYPVQLAAGPLHAGIGVGKCERCLKYHLGPCMPGAIQGEGKTSAALGAGLAHDGHD